MCLLWIAWLLGVLRAWVQGFLLSPYSAPTFSTSSSFSHSMLAFCQTTSLLALNFCRVGLGGEGGMKSALGELEGVETAAFNKMGWRREARHLDPGGKAEVW